MFGTLILTKLLCQRSAPHRGPVQLPLASDNQGNIYGLLNEYSKKMPTAGLLMEVMLQLTANTCTFLPTHVKRDFNQWPYAPLLHWLWLGSITSSVATIGWPQALPMDPTTSWSTRRSSTRGRDGACRSCPRPETVESVDVRLGWSVPPTTILSSCLSGSGMPLIVFPTVGLQSEDLVGLCQPLALLVRLGFGPSEGTRILDPGLSGHWLLPANRPGLHKLAPQSQNKRLCCWWGAVLMSLFRRTFLVTDIIIDNWHSINECHFWLAIAFVDLHLGLPLLVHCQSRNGHFGFAVFVEAFCAIASGGTGEAGYGRNATSCWLLHCRFVSLREEKPGKMAD